MSGTVMQAGVFGARTYGFRVRWRNITLLCVMVLACIAIAVVIQFLPPHETPPPLPAHLSRAAWIGIEWAMDAHSDADIRTFAEELTARRVRYAYFYVSYLKHEGVFNATYSHAADFTRRMREHAPDIVLLAWVGRFRA